MRRGDRFRQLPEEVRTLFETYARLVNEQVLSVLDELEVEIERLDL